MLRVLLLTAALSIPGAAFGQEVAAGFTPIFDENPLQTGGLAEEDANFTPIYDLGPIRPGDIVVVAEPRPFAQETREEWRSPVTSQVMGMPGVEYHVRTTVLGRGEGYLVDFRQITLRDRAGRDYGAGEPDDDTLRLVIPFPCEGCGK
jgi:hypothetical protein